jgi:hypothetical protein
MEKTKISAKGALSAMICAFSYLPLLGTSVESLVSLRKKTRQKAVLNSKHLLGRIYEQLIPLYSH